MKDIHRITLHSTDIEYIMEFCRAHRDDDRSLSVISRLSALHAKIKDGVAIPAYVTTKLTRAESLGFDTPVDSKAQRRKLYEQWVANPSSVGAAELNLVDAYRSENDLMTDEEQEEYQQRFMR